MPAPVTYFWDMDHTLLDNDCDVSWKEFLIAEGLAPPETAADIAKFWEQYARGALDHAAFVEFQLREFVGKNVAEMAALAQRHYQKVVVARIYPQGRALVAAQLAAGHDVYLLTATNRVIATPVATALGIRQVLATELELVDGHYTGRIQGPYCSGEGKTAVLRTTAAALGRDLADIAYYGDSLADIPVLRVVGHPYCVNPMPGLRTEALTHGWPILAFAKP